MSDEQLKNFAGRYADAWCSRNPEKVAAFYAKSGSISVNGDFDRRGCARI
jgi:hypothetical protein